MANETKWKDRNYCCILYPDTNPNHGAILERIRNSFNYAAMMHDKDVNEDGTPKQPHYHVMFRFKQPRWNTAVADELGLELNLLRRLASIEAYGIYCTHLNEEHKYQYSIDEMEGPLKEIVRKALTKDDSEDEKALSLLDLIDSATTEITYGNLLRLACSHGLYSYLRRNGYMFSKVLEEHNEHIRLLAAMSDHGTPA